ncbi:hypothetical protein N7532_000441 [Penicillium argentinense]|uniref:Uncharacterized protein n=1 Tax=Penicillium argentinense TaxID=1131581 RepID=A0A9W9KNV3_9EURO|nr:uncharacterized protein N7532_000441 [Penicillium argentinense]KAJ5112396.1 hypothetical protein N7532_000441 [Penicillium argentinense]
MSEWMGDGDELYEVGRGIGGYVRDMLSAISTSSWVFLTRTSSFSFSYPWHYWYDAELCQSIAPSTISYSYTNVTRCLDRATATSELGMHKSGGLSTGGKAEDGIDIGVGGLAILLTVLFCLRRKKLKRRADSLSREKGPEARNLRVPPNGTFEPQPWEAMLFMNLADRRRLFMKLSRM